MLFLLLSITNKRYALSAEHIIEVIPNILEANTTSPKTPEYFAGRINYYGSLLPVADICQMHAGIPCVNKISTRIILIRHRNSDGQETTIGLLAEKVTETVKVGKKEKNITHADSGKSFLQVGIDGKSSKIEIFDLSVMLPSNFEVFCKK
jgi:chemotaxis-related protein WspB